MALMPMHRPAARAAHWGGVMDMSMDGSPIIDRTPIDGLYLNAGWCYGGFKATPASGWCFAHLIARDEPHPVARRLPLDRFATGALIDERGAGRAAQPALRDRDAHSPAPTAASATCSEFGYLGDADASSGPTRQRRTPRRALLRLRLSARQPGRAASRVLVSRAGCRAWLVVTRDTRTHEILAVAASRGDARASAAGRRP